LIPTLLARNTPASQVLARVIFTAPPSAPCARRSDARSRPIGQTGDWQKQRDIGICRRSRASALMPGCVRSAVTLGRAKTLLTRWLQREERFLVQG
jgi:hypothetical protein